MVLVWCIGLSPGLVHANSEIDIVETGRLLATLLDAGRVTVGLNQGLLNDPSKGDKGFTPEVFEKQLVALYQERMGIDLSNIQHAPIPDMANPLLTRLIEESKKTIESYQTVINIKGIKYKGLIPATFGTETAKRFQNWSQVYLKQTAPDHFLRNPKNKADAFEKDAMQSFATTDPHDPKAIFSKTIIEEKSVRVMLPLYYEPACLRCHGGPKGERDISGYLKEGGKEGELKEGGKEGELAGAISVKLPLP
jgi:general secretion pathway protein A